MDDAGDSSQTVVMFDGAQVEFHKHFKLNLPVVYRDSDEGDLNDTISNNTLYEHEGNFVNAQLTVTKTQAGNSALLYYGLPGSNKVYSTTIDIACVMVKGKNKNPHSNIVSQGLLASKHGEPQTELLKYTQTVILPNLKTLWDNRIVLKIGRAHV